MAKSRDTDLLLACQCSVRGAGEKVILAVRAAIYRGVSTKSGNLAPSMAKPMVLAVCVIESGQQASAVLRVFEHLSAGVTQLKPMIKVYKLKYISKVEVITNDPSGCSFSLGFDKVRNQSVSSPQWTAYNIDDRNLLLLCILKTCKDMVGRIPRVFGVDMVQMALWLKERETTSFNQESSQDEPMTTMMSETDLHVTVNNELASQAEEGDMQSLLDSYVMGIGEAEAFSDTLKREIHALEAANVHHILAIDPLVNEVLQGLDTALNYTSEMEELLSTFNVKLKFMRDDIESVETLNNSLELQTVNCKALDEELAQLLEKLRIPSEYSACLTKGSFDEKNMPRIMEACEWLNLALAGLELPKLDPGYMNMRAVKVKRVELKKLKTTFVGRASEFIKRYLTSMVDYMIRDKTTSRDHKDLHNKCSTYADLLMHLKRLDKNCLGQLRKAYCSSFNLLLRREVREFANELRTSSQVSRNPISIFDASAGSVQSKKSTDTSAVSNAYAKMLTNLIPHLEQEMTFFAQFMCFETPTPTNITDANNAELVLLNEYLQELLDGIQEDFYTIIEWGNKIDPLRCISMNGITTQTLSAKQPSAAKFVVVLLTELQSRTVAMFTRFVEEYCHRIEIIENNGRPASGVHSHVIRYAALATCMEQCIHGKPRDLADNAYAKIGNTLFLTLNKIARADPKYGDVFLLENYAAFQTSLYELANLVPALAELYKQASDAYEQACTRYVHMIIYNQFEQLFQYATKIEDLIMTNTPEEIHSMRGMSTTDLRRVLKITLSEIERSVNAMYKALQRNMTLKELVRPLHIRFKKEFISKYQSVVELVGNIYPTESKLMPSVAQVRDLLASIEEAYFS